MKFFSLRAALLSCSMLLTLGSCADWVAGDEIIIDNQEEIGVELGGFNCSPYHSKVNQSLNILDRAQSGGEVSAGELWQFLHSQGVESLDRLTLSLDVDKLDSRSNFDLQGIDFSIEDPDVIGNFITNVTLGNNSIIVPGDRTSAFKPEAKLQVQLGYDFMQRFSAGSQEKIKLDVSSGDLAGNASFSIEGNEQFFSKLNITLLIAFVLFWLLVFVVLARMTKPENESEPDSQIQSPPAVNSNANSKQALSA